MKIELEVTEGPSRGSRYEFEGYQAFVLGRAVRDDSGFRIPTDPYFSRYHMLFEFVGNRCVLRDMESRNGVFVNDERIVEVDLQDGDIIRAGRSALRVHAHPDVVSAARGESSLPRHGDRLGRFIVGDYLARGAQGVIYEATDSNSHKPVALKVLHAPAFPGDKAARLFLREIDVLSGLNHPRIVQFLGAGREDGCLWLAMELVDGPNLEELVELEGALSASKATRFAGDVLEALIFAHAKGIVHRDLNPRNILINTGAEDRIAMIADFGLAKPCRELGLQSLTGSGEMRGTPRFMPPEQLLNAKSAGPEADVYGFGATVYWALTQAWHIEGDPESASVWQRILNGQRVPLGDRAPGLPQDLIRVVERCLARDPADRFRSAAEVLRALKGPGPEGEPVTLS